MVINYVSSHDNNTLWDKRAISAKNCTEDERRRMDKLAAAIILQSFMDYLSNNPEEKEALIRRAAEL